MKSLIVRLDNIKELAEKGYTEVSGNNNELIALELGTMDKVELKAMKEKIKNLKILLINWGVLKMVKHKKGYCHNCENGHNDEKCKLKPTEQIINGYICKICGSVYLKDKIGRFRFYY